MTGCCCFKKRKKPKKSQDGISIEEANDNQDNTSSVKPEQSPANIPVTLSTAGDQRSKVSSVVVSKSGSQDSIALSMKHSTSVPVKSTLNSQDEVVLSQRESRSIYKDSTAALKSPSRPSSTDHSPRKTQSRSSPVSLNSSGSKRGVYRIKLPAPKDERGFSIWGLIKSAIGKDVSKISMPVQINEPISFLQRVAEYCEFTHVIDKAILCEDPIERMEYVSAFLVSALSASYKRRNKPFNPVLGETFEFDRPDLGFRFVAEQVSHHPPVSAFHCEGSRNGGYAFYGSMQPKVKFTGRQLDVTPKGVIRLKLHKFGELYRGIQTESFHLVVHNILNKQDTWLQHKGVVSLIKTKGNIKCDLEFKTFEGNHHFVEGAVYENGIQKRTLFGSWVINMYSCDTKVFEEYKHSGKSKEHTRNFLKRQKDHNQINKAKRSLVTFQFETANRKTLWIGHDKYNLDEKMYNFSRYTMSLNELLPGMEKTLPKTDSRLRKDMRLMEEGHFEAAQEMKIQIEAKQRHDRGELEKKGEIHKPRWFDEKQTDEFIFNHKYWKNKLVDKKPFFI